MEKLELLGIDNPYQKVKFISILKPHTEHTTGELANIYDRLCRGEKTTIELMSQGVSGLNGIAVELMEHIDVRFGYASWHEENGAELL